MTAVFHLAALRSVMHPERVLDVVREAVVAHAQGRIVSPAPIQLLFDDPPGDCHVKCGYRRGGQIFVVKVATGFYGNPQSGRPVNNGLAMVFSATTGEPLAILQDEGWLTSWRTAAAGALAIKAGAAPSVTRLGVVGAGHQAELQAIWSSRALGGIPVVIWGRSMERARSLAARLEAKGLQIEVAPTVAELLAVCRAVTVCTSSRAPVIAASDVAPGTHLVSLGADSAGKRELDPALFGLAAAIACDDPDHCLSHGDLGFAVRAGFTRAEASVHLGDVLSGTETLRRRADDITIVSLMGLGAEDLAIATLAWEELGANCSAEDAGSDRRAP
jgi:ornithine cyclodeaminase